MAGELSPQRHRDLELSCEVNDAFRGVVTARASSWMRTKDMKNNNGARVPQFYKLKAKIEIRRWAPNMLGQEAWRNLDRHTFETVWVERRGVWIVEQSQQPPNTVGNAARGFWRQAFGDSTTMAAPGEYVSAKYTVWLDKKPGGKKWEYQRETNYVLCPSEPGQKATAAPRAKKKATKKASTPPTNGTTAGGGTPGGGTDSGGMTGGEATLPDGRLPTCPGRCGGD